MARSHFITSINCEWLRKRLAAFSGENVLDVVHDYASGHFRD